MVFHLSNLPEQLQGSAAVSCSDAAVEERPCAASDVAAGPRTSAEGTEQLSWGADARPVESPVQHVCLSRCRQRSEVAAFERRK